jgi:hypothetical protein
MADESNASLNEIASRLRRQVEQADERAKPPTPRQRVNERSSPNFGGVLGAYMVSFIQVIELPAVVVLGFWILMQFLLSASNLQSPSVSVAGGTAFWAHIGGFATRLALLQIAQPRSAALND